MLNYNETMKNYTQFVLTALLILAILNLTLESCFMGNSETTTVTQVTPTTIAPSSPKRRVMIVIPYRNREKNLKFYRHYMEGFFLRDQRADNPDVLIETLIVEQANKKLFNRGVLGNVGVIEAEKRGLTDDDCVLLHDVDLLPVPGVDYVNCDKAYSLSRSIQSKYKEMWHVMPGPYYGGVLTMSIRDWKRCNGFDNSLYGWGGEDDLLFIRCTLAGVIKGGEIQNHVHKGGELRYFNIHGNGDHREAKNKTSLDRYHKKLKNDRSDSYKKHGLNDVSYSIKNVERIDGFTELIKVRF